MNDYITALLLGFSFGNLWLCVLLVFSLQTANRSTSAGYLIGRALAIMALSVVVAALGQVVTIEKVWLNYSTGALLIGFSLYLIATRLLEWTPPWRKKIGADGEASSGCDGNCHDCPSHTVEEYADACGECDHHGLCAAEEPEVEQLTRQARLTRGRQTGSIDKSGFTFGITIGALRGAAVCGKLAVLIPVLLTVSVPKALGLGAIFSVSSSIYPLIGFFFGAVALKLVKYKVWLFTVSCGLLILSGAHYIFMGATCVN
jgi:hypothetical protein